MEEERFTTHLLPPKSSPKKASNPPTTCAAFAARGKRQTMKKSPVHPKYELGFDGSNRFDPQNDFYQFLEEAKQYAIESDFQTSAPYPEETGERRLGQEKKKKKKSWKKLLFPWLKGEKMNKTSTKPATKSQVSDARRTNVSGPVYGTGKAMDGQDGRQRRPLSGPITGLFKPTKRADDEIPYKCLEKTDSRKVVQTYGPVYLVT